MEQKQNDHQERPLTFPAPEHSGMDASPCCPLKTEEAVQQAARAVRRRGNWDLLAEVTEYMDAHLGEKISLRTAAEHCGVSVSSITQLFQKKGGTTFHRCLTQRRMLLTEELIRQGIPMEQIYLQVGYTDYSSFYRAFCQHFGTSPRAYKQGKHG